MHVLNEIRFSGAETMLASAASCWQDRGLELHALSTGGDEGVYAEVLRKHGYAVYHIPYRKNLWFIVKIWRLLRMLEIDVLHIHPERAYFQYAVAGLLAGCSVRIRTVHHIFAYKGVHVLRPWLLRNICRSLLGVVFVSNSRSGKSTEMSLYGFDNFYIPNWFDSHVYTEEAIAKYSALRAEIRQKVGVCSGERLLVSLGGNSDYKNYDLVVKALGYSDLKGRYRYVHIGHDSERRLPILASALGVSFSSLGCIDNAMPYLLAADLVMMPSREEGFGVAAVEAMALGCPLCLSLRPALIDFKADNDSLFWCQPTVEGIHEFLVQFPGLTTVQRAVIAQKSIRCSGLYTIERCAGMYAELYDTLLCAREKA